MDGESLPGRDAEVRRVRAALGGATRVAVLHGPPGCGKSAVARVLAASVARTHRLPAHWMAVGRRPADPERLLRRAARRRSHSPRPARSCCSTCCSAESANPSHSSAASSPRYCAIGHSFGCRFLCEAVQWAADEESLTLGWSTPEPHGRPFTVDSMLLLQMAAPRDAFATTFTALAKAPLRGPVVATYTQHDRATGFWHLRAERRAGIGYAGIGTAPAPVSGIRMLSPDEPYPLSALDHRFVSVDASDVFMHGSGPAGAHSDHLRPESAHLLLSLADHCR